jgi:glutathione S-transferase
MAEYTLHCFAPSGISAWLERIRSTPGWVHPYTLLPGHPLPAKA